MAAGVEGWLSGWLLGLVADWLVKWLVGWVAGWLVVFFLVTGCLVIKLNNKTSVLSYAHDSNIQIVVVLDINM